MDQGQIMQWSRDIDLASEDLVALSLPLAICVVVYRIAQAGIDKAGDKPSVISRLLSDSRGRLSLARAQMLLVTLVSLTLYVDLSVEAGALAEIPGALLAFVGFSHATFLISLAIEAPPPAEDANRSNALRDTTTQVPSQEPPPDATAE